MKKNHDAAALKQEIEEYGYLVVRDLIPRDQALVVSDRLKAIMSGQPNADEPEVHIRALMNHCDSADGKLFLPLITHPLILELSGLLMGRDYQLAEVGARWRRGNSPSLPLHVGAPLNHFTDSSLPIPAAFFVLTFSWILDDMNADNGERLFMPFSQHSRSVPRAGVDYHSLATIHAGAGSLVLFNSACWHVIAENKPVCEERVELASAYHAAWLDPHAVGWQLMSPDVLERMPESVKKMHNSAH